MGRQTREQNAPSPQVLSEQSRAKRAWDCIQQVTARQKEYGALARGLPAMLQVNGLGQTLAFLKAKAASKPNRQNQFEDIYKHLSGWVMKQMGQPENRDLLEWVMGQSSDQYRQAATEAIAFGMWLRRLAEGQGWGSEPGTEED